MLDYLFSWSAYILQNGTQNLARSRYTSRVETGLRLIVGSTDVKLPQFDQVFTTHSPLIDQLNLPTGLQDKSGEPLELI